MTNKQIVQSVIEIKQAIKETSFLSYTAKDILDELNILMSIARYQKNVQGQIYPKAADAHHTATHIMDDIWKMEGVVKQIQSAVREKRSSTNSIRLTI